MRQQRPYRAITFAWIAVVLSSGAALAQEPGGGHEEHAAMSAAATPAATIFERLKGLNGSWKEVAESTEASGEEAFETFRVSAAGTVVMETMFPGTEHEMINMYHLDGDDLVLTHYCAGGNQPTMRLAEISEDGRTLHFEFTGGTNLDPAVDPHIHETTLTFLDPNTFEARWIGYAGGKPGDAMTMTLHRVE